MLQDVDDGTLGGEHGVIISFFLKKNDNCLESFSNVMRLACSSTSLSLLWWNHHRQGVLEIALSSGTNCSSWVQRRTRPRTASVANCVSGSKCRISAACVRPRQRFGQVVVWAEFSLSPQGRALRTSTSATSSAIQPWLQNALSTELRLSGKLSSAGSGSTRAS